MTDFKEANEEQKQQPALWLDKPYYSLHAYLKKTFGEKIYKIALDGGFTCPNRDGSKGSRGCIFCSAGGSGEFATAVACREFPFSASIDAQIRDGLAKFGSKQVGHRFIAYFQAYSGTYDRPERLYALYHAALSHPSVVGLSIATRPDCLEVPVLEVLARCQREFPKKFLWIELGLQTIHARTAKYIRRGYPLSCFEDALRRLHALQIPVIVHVILGLPGESDAAMLETIAYLNRCHIFGIKLQLLHVLKGTDLAADYESGAFSCLSKERYIQLLISCIEHLSADVILHRVTGDGPAKLLVAPTWSLNKRDVLNTLHKTMKEGHNYQGRLHKTSRETEQV